MKRLLPTILLLGLLPLQWGFAQDVPPGKVGDTYHFECENIYFEADGAFGGQVSAFRLETDELLYFSGEANDYLVGSTLWPSPQNVWGWPPPAALDREPYEVMIVENQVIMESEKDPGSELVFRKTYSASSNDTSVTLLYTIINEGSDPYSVAAWEVTRVPSESTITFFPAGEGAVTGDFADQTTTLNGIVWYEQENSNPTGKKFFSDGSEGWLAHVTADNQLFIKTFPDIPADRQAPGEAEIELFYSGPTTYIELENQSAYREIPSGESAGYKVRWFARNLPASVDVSVGSGSLLDYTRSVINRFTGASDAQAEGVLTISPNPASDDIRIRHATAPLQDFRLYDLSGRTVMQQQTPGNNRTISLEGIGSGCYLYSVQYRGEKHSGKIMVR